ncbi:MAG: c-type cytochrome domain-containing protein [Planctomycetota bacterium]|nr:c-type cytochrome domain-containing protein [Planctomycetota bacterium]
MNSLLDRMYFFLLGFSLSCAVPCHGYAGDVVSYTADIKPILRRHCFKCHGNDEQNADLNLQNYATLLKGGSAGPVVKPGRPSASLLYQAITAEDEGARMPPQSPPLAREKIALIRKWIQSGVRETTSSRSLAARRTVTFNPAANAAVKPAGAPPMPAQLPEIKVPETARRLPVLALAANPWSPLLAAAGYGHIRLFDISTQKPIGALAFPEGIPQVVQFSRNGGVLLAAGGKPVQSGSVVLFDVRTGKRLAQLGDELDAVMAADISPDQRLVALGGAGRVVKVYSTEDGALRFKAARHTDWITAIAFSPDGKQLATADRAGGIHLWDARTGGILLSLANHTAAIRALAWRSDSKLLATGGEDGKLIWWNTTDGFIVTVHARPHAPIRTPGTFGRLPSGVLAVSFASDGRLLSCGRDKLARLWKADGSQAKTYSYAPAMPTAVAISHDGQTVIVGDASGMVHFSQ